MRIIHAIRSDGFAGVETHVARLAATQHDQGHHLTVIGGDPASMTATVARDEVDLIAATTVWDVAHALRRVAGRHRTAVVHTHMTAAEVAAVLAVPPPRTRVVTTRHFAAPRGSGIGGRVAARMVPRHMAVQISVSHYISEHIDGPSRVVYPGVPSFDAGAGAAGRKPTILLVQRLEPEKETALAVHAFAKSGLVGDGWRLDVVGDGSQRGELEKLTAELGVADAVTFLGRKTDVAARMRRAGILHAPCSIEGLGLTVIEAMAAGVPVVAAASGGHLETVGRVPGATLHAPGDIDDATAQLRELARDSARRIAYGAASQDVQRTRFTLQAQAEAIETVYREVL